MQVTSWRYPAFADLRHFLLRPDSRLSEQEKEDMLASFGIIQCKILSKNAVDAIGSKMKIWWPNASDNIIEKVSAWYRGKQAELDDEILGMECADDRYSFDTISDCKTKPHHLALGLQSYQFDELFESTNKGRHKQHLLQYAAMSAAACSPADVDACAAHLVAEMDADALIPADTSMVIESAFLEFMVRVLYQLDSAFAHALKEHMHKVLEQINPKTDRIDHS
jgi:hypothetical protein